MKAEQVKNSLKKLSSKKKAEVNQYFFKTGKGEYGEGDKFIGVTMPEMRSVAKEFVDLSFVEIKKLLDSKIHEHRMTGLIILTYKFEKRDPRKTCLSGRQGEDDNIRSGDDGDIRKKIFNFYLKNTKAINNWDLVDVSCPNIIGEYLLYLPSENKDKDRKILYKLSKSKDLWEQRISIVSTWSFIRKGDFEDTLKISEILLNHEHDLIHKAVGWMLREVGKKNKDGELLLKKFLKKHYKKMPRTMLRYAIEKFPEKERNRYLKGLI